MHKTSGRGRGTIRVGGLRMVEYAHANELHHEISEGQGSNRDRSEVDIITAQGAGKLPDMLQGADLARRSSSIP